MIKKHDNMKLAKMIVNKVVKDNKLLSYLLYIKKYDEITYYHCLDVARLATCVGLELNLSNDELSKLTLIGLLHDIGKIKISRVILNKPSKLTIDEYTEIKNHSIYGYDMLDGNFSNEVKLGILQHHENEDGTGYPNKLKSNEIHPFAKIVHIADVYDALISERPYKKSKPLQEVLDYMEENRGIMFDEKYLNVFIECVKSS